MSVKKGPGNLIGIALELYVAFGRMIIVDKIHSSIYVHSRSFHLLGSPSTFSCVLKFSLSSSFISLVRFMPRYFILFDFGGYCEWHHFPDFFFSVFVFGTWKTYWFLSPAILLEVLTSCVHFLVESFAQTLTSAPCSEQRPLLGIFVKCSKNPGGLASITSWQFSCFGHFWIFQLAVSQSLLSG